MANNEDDLVYRILEQRTRLEDQIIALGGKIPPRWAWDTTGELRNLQLLELREELQCKK